MAMYQIWANNREAAVPKLLAIMPEDVMCQALRLAPEAVQRLQRETQHNGLCMLHFNGRQRINGFSDSVLVSLFDEGRLSR